MHPRDAHIRRSRPNLAQTNTVHVKSRGLKGSPRCAPVACSAHNLALRSMQDPTREPVYAPPGAGQRLPRELSPAVAPRDPADGSKLKLHVSDLHCDSLREAATRTASCSDRPTAGQPAHCPRRGVGPTTRQAPIRARASHAGRALVPARRRCPHADAQRAPPRSTMSPGQHSVAHPPHFDTHMATAHDRCRPRTRHLVGVLQTKLPPTNRATGRCGRVGGRATVPAPPPTLDTRLGP